MAPRSTEGPPPWAAWPSRAQACILSYWVSLRPFPGHRRSRQGSSDCVTGALSQGRRFTEFPYVAERANVPCPNRAQVEVGM